MFGKKVSKFSSVEPQSSEETSTVCCNRKGVFLSKTEQMTILCGCFWFSMSQNICRCRKVCFLCIVVASVLLLYPIYRIWGLVWQFLYGNFTLKLPRFPEVFSLCYLQRVLANFLENGSIARCYAGKQGSFQQLLIESIALAWLDTSEVGLATIRQKNHCFMHHVSENK